jgi:hypothetical protein
MIQSNPSLTTAKAWSFLPHNSTKAGKPGSVPARDSTASISCLPGAIVAKQPSSPYCVLISLRSQRRLSARQLGPAKASYSSYTVSQSEIAGSKSQSTARRLADGMAPNESLGQAGYEAMRVYLLRLARLFLGRNETTQASSASSLTTFGSQSAPSPTA